MRAIIRIIGLENPLIASEKVKIPDSDIAVSASIATISGLILLEIKRTMLTARMANMIIKFLSDIKNLLSQIIKMRIRYGIQAYINQKRNKCKITIFLTCKNRPKLEFF